jgi:hypothetical protein
MIRMLALLVVAHLLADYPLQGDFMAKAKNCTAPFPGVPWQTILLSHAAIHAGFVWLITGSVWCAAFELVAHTYIDHAKCKGYIGFNADQALHIACKVAYAILAS